jgi:hypothetical protein
VLSSAFDLQDLRGLRMAARDLGDMIGFLPPPQRHDLMKDVERTTGISLVALRAKDAKAAASIIQRGKIRNEKEYFVLRSHLDRLETQQSSADDAASVARLLESYGASGGGAAT